MASGSESTDIQPKGTLKYSPAKAFSWSYCTGTANIQVTLTFSIFLPCKLHSIIV